MFSSTRNEKVQTIRRIYSLARSSLLCSYFVFITRRRPITCLVFSNFTHHIATPNVSVKKTHAIVILTKEFSSKYEQKES